MRHSIWILPLAVALACAACTGKADHAATTPAPAGADAGERPAAAGPEDAQPAPPGRQAPEPTEPIAPAIAYAGYGSARFGASADEVRAAWGQDMVGGPSEPGGCYYLYPQPRGPLGFMFEDQRFVRIDVGDAGIEAPGGGRIGMSVEEIRKRYADLVEQPHKYDEGARYLRHVDAGSGNALVFETDAAGQVASWRVGMVPQVDYVEGCG